jgi:hypothetical protein
MASINSNIIKFLEVYVSPAWLAEHKITITRNTKFIDELSFDICDEVCVTRYLNNLLNTDIRYPYDKWFTTVGELIDYIEVHYGKDI